VKIEFVVFCVVVSLCRMVSWSDTNVSEDFCSLTKSWKPLKHWMIAGRPSLRPKWPLVILRAHHSTHTPPSSPPFFFLLFPSVPFLPFFFCCTLPARPFSENFPSALSTSHLHFSFSRLHSGHFVHMLSIGSHFSLPNPYLSSYPVHFPVITHFIPEDGRSTVVRSVGIHSSHYTAQQPKRPRILWLGLVVPKPMSVSIKL